MCVCGSLRRQRDPPNPTGQRRRIVVEATGVNPFGAVSIIGATATRGPGPCSVRHCASVWSHPCVFSQFTFFFGTLRSCFYHLKKGMGDQRREYDVAGPSRSGHSNVIWFQIEWSAWKSSTSDPPGTTFVHGPAKCVRIWQTQMASDRQRSDLCAQRGSAKAAVLRAVTGAASHKMLNLVSLAEGCSSYSCCWKHPRNSPDPWSINPRGENPADRYEAEG